VTGDFRVGHWLVAPSLNTVSFNGTSLRVEPKVMEVLVCLAQHSGEPLSKEELLRSVWPDTFVSDDVLTRSISELRRAFVDDAKEPRFIQTIPRRGYRLVAPVTPANGTPAVSSLPSKPKAPSGRSVRLGLGGVLLAVAALITLLLGVRAALNRNSASLPVVPSDSSSIHALAVLPLQNLSDDPEQAYLADGLAKELTMNLSQVSSLRVASHEAVSRFRKPGIPLAEIARQLNVDALVQGSLQRSGDRVHINVQLLYGPQGQNVWSRTYELDVRDVVTLQGTIANTIAEELRAKISSPEKASLKPSDSHPANPQALEDLLQGRYHTDQAYEAIVFKSGGMAKSEEEFSKGMFYLERAIQEDPKYVPAYLELARAIMREPPHVNLRPKAREALTKAQAIDDADPAVHLMMAKYLGFGEGWDDSESHYQKAVELAPSSADAHQSYARYLDDIGRFEQAMREHEKAQALDPDQDYIGSSPLIPLATRLQRKRTFMLLSSPSGYDYWTRGEMEFELGQYGAALKDWEVAARCYEWDAEADAWDRAFHAGGSQALIHEVARTMDEIAKTRYFPRDLIINAHRYAGDRNGALAWLEVAQKEQNDLCLHLRSDYRWDPYRSDPRFQSALSRAGLAP
jgi:DNA-binding winged helix-turn-helix (wHTH) protein/TolB-like protein